MFLKYDVLIVFFFIYHEYSYSIKRSFYNDIAKHGHSEN